MRVQVDIEKLLAETPVPSVAEGLHKAKLKRELLRQIQGKETRMGIWKTIFLTPKRRLAFACSAVLVLVATAWGVEKVHEKITSFFAYKPVIVDTVPAEKVTSPDGTETSLSSTLSVSASCWPVDLVFANGETRQQFEEVKGLIAPKIYNLVGGPTWFRRRHKGIKEAIVAGRVRFISVLDVEVHICKDSDSGEKVRVQRVVMPDGNEVACVSPYPSVGPVGTRYYSMSWQDHLRTLDNGARELINKQLFKLYRYEATLADGSIAIYGSNVPPKEREEIKK